MSILTPHAGVIALLFWLQPKEYDYQKPLGHSFLFYESHRSGAAWQLSLV